MEGKRFEQINKLLVSHFAKQLSGNKRSYEQHRALFLTWNGASDSNAKELQSTLERAYGFEGESFQIPSDHAEDTLKDRIQSFADLGNSANSLLLLYYAGGGLIRGNDLFWTSNGQPSEPPEIEWYPLQEILQSCQSNILVITDYDYHQEPPYSLSHSSTKCDKGIEILSAPSLNRTEDGSFTVRLRQVLESFDQESLTINSLASKMIYWKDRKRIAPHYFNLSTRRQPDIVLHRFIDDETNTLSLELTLKKQLNDTAETQLQKWILTAPFTIKKARFDESHEGRENFLVWIGDYAPDCLEANIHHSIELPAKPASKAGESKPSEADYEALAAKWNQERSWQGVQDKRSGDYKKVIILPIYWECTGFEADEIEKETANLMAVFTESFGYEVKEVFKIPVDRAQEDWGEIKLREEIEKLLDPKRPDSLGRDDLLIIYYNGHAQDTYNVGGARWASGTLDETGRTEYVNWSPMVAKLNDADCDVAQILDCCYAANATKSHGKPRNIIDSYSKSSTKKSHSNGRKEFSSACSREAKATAGSQSYTRVFTKVLRKLAQLGEPFSFRSLHYEVDSEQVRQNNSGLCAHRYPQSQYKAMNPDKSSTMLRPILATHGLVTNQFIRDLNHIDSQAVGYIYQRIGVNSQLQKVSSEYFTETKLREQFQTYLKQAI